MMCLNETYTTSNYFVPVKTRSLSTAICFCFNIIDYICKYLDKHIQMSVVFA